MARLPSDLWFCIGTELDPEDVPSFLGTCRKIRSIKNRLEPFQRQKLLEEWRELIKTPTDELEIEDYFRNGERRLKRSSLLLRIPDMAIYEELIEAYRRNRKVCPASPDLAIRQLASKKREDEWQAVQKKMHGLIRLLLRTPAFREALFEQSPFDNWQTDFGTVRKVLVQINTRTCLDSENEGPVYLELIDWTYLLRHIRWIAGPTSETLQKSILLHLDRWKVEPGFSGARMYSFMYGTNLGGWMQATLSRRMLHMLAPFAYGTCWRDLLRPSEKQLFRRAVDMIKANSPQALDHIREHGLMEKYGYRLRRFYQHYRGVPLIVP